MNEQLPQHNLSGDPTNIVINSTLVSMQIQALRESLRRLVESEEESETELSDNPQLRPTC